MTAGSLFNLEIAGWAHTFLLDGIKRTVDYVVEPQGLVLAGDVEGLEIERVVLHQNRLSHLWDYAYWQVLLSYSGRHTAGPTTAAQTTGML